MRSVWGMVLMLLIATSTYAGTSDLTGRATVIDADTIEIHGHRIRLNGIDAPESDQLCAGADGKSYRCGQKASLALADYLAARTVDCIDTDERTYKRIVAVCSVAGVDLADWLVRSGWALDWPRYSGGSYADAQADARREKRGIWAGGFNRPWDYRSCRRDGRRIDKCSTAGRE